MNKPPTPAERQQNKETLELATKIRTEREQEFKESMLGYRLKKDLHMVQIALSHFKDFLKEQYPLYECNIKPEFITKDMIV